MQDDDETPGDEHKDALMRYSESLSKSIRAQAGTTTKIIEVVRELLAAFPVETEGPGPAQNTALGDHSWLLAFGELAQKPTGLSQMQSLSMLAAVIRWFSIESGRSEAEILERLAAPSEEFRDEIPSVIKQIVKDFRDTGRGNKA